jgi:hypothetical protein
MHTSVVPERPAGEAWRVRARRIVCIVLIGAALAGCDRCGDLAVPGMTACRQEAPKQR